MKKILICIQGGSGEMVTQFERKMTDVAGTRTCRVCRCVAALESELRRPWSSYDLIVLFAANDKDLDLFVSLHELLEGVPVLLVVAESNHDVWKRAHQLRPRFISFANGDFSDVAAVMGKMICNREKAQIRSGEITAFGQTH